MNAAVGAVFIDTCTFENFAAVDRLDLLEGLYGHRAVWTETIEDEVSRGQRREPRLRKVLDAAWLGEPIELDFDPSALREIELIRRGLSDGRPPRYNTEHLGEAEVLYLLEHDYRGALFVTDDQPALDLARNRGHMVRDSPEVLAECFANFEVGCPEAYQLLERMADANRGVRLPSSHMEVCPS